jgi:hypothetical protein
MRYFLIATLAAGGALAAAVTAPANASPLPSITTPQAAPAAVENVGYWRRQMRRGYIAPAPVVTAPTVVVPGGPVVLYRPACGEFRYWNGSGCVDVRYIDPYFKG